MYTDLQISYKKCLIWPFIGRVRYREVSSRWYCELGPRNVIRYREVSATQKFCYENLTVILSIPEESVRCIEVSNIRRFHCKPKIFRISHDRGLSWSSPWVCIYLNDLSPERMDDTLSLEKNTYNLRNLHLFQCRNPRSKDLVQIILPNELRKFYKISLMKKRLSFVRGF